MKLLLQRLFTGAVWLWVAGCSSNTTFPVAARPGDSIMLPIGWRTNVTRDNLTVTFQAAAGGATTTYAPSDPNVRAVLKLYPDPVSRLVVGTETQQGFGTNAAQYGNLLNDRVTNQDRDWWQSVVYLDIPRVLSAGRTLVTLSTPQGRVGDPITIDILSGVGSASDGGASSLFSGQDATKIFQSLERADHKTVSFVGKTIPHSIQIEFSHTPGVGRPWLVNPRGDIKNITWSAAGATITALLTPTHGFTLDYLTDFKFYVAGGLADLKVTRIRAYDLSGKPLTDIAVDLR